MPISPAWPRWHWYFERSDEMPYRYMLPKCTNCNKKACSHDLNTKFFMKVLFLRQKSLALFDSIRNKHSKNNGARFADCRLNGINDKVKAGVGEVCTTTFVECHWFRRGSLKQPVALSVAQCLFLIINASASHSGP